MKIHKADFSRLFDKLSYKNNSASYGVKFT